MLTCHGKQGLGVDHGGSDSSETRLGSDSLERAQHLLGLCQQRRVYPNGLREAK